MKRIAYLIGLVTMVLALAAPAAAQNWAPTFDERMNTAADLTLLVYDPDLAILTEEGESTGETGGYVTMTLDVLLHGLVDFPDTLTRYAALKAFDPDNPSRPSFEVGDFTASTATTSNDNRAALAVPAVISGSDSSWLAVAVPTGTLTYISLQSFARSENEISLWEAQADTVTLNNGTEDADYDVWVLTGATGNVGLNFPDTGFRFSAQANLN